MSYRLARWVKDADHIWQNDLPQLKYPGLMHAEHWGDFNSRPFEELFAFVDHCHQMVWRYCCENSLLENFGKPGYRYYDIIKKSAPWLMDYMDYYSFTPYI